jgi:hypothetical protein
MAITNIGTLQTATESWMERTFDDSIFLEWANSVADKLMYGVMGPDARTWVVPPLRVRAMHETATLTTSSAAVALPSDWLEFTRVWIDSANDGGDLLYVPLAQFKSMADAQLTGTPKKYTMYVAPTSDASIEVSYYEKLGAFTGDASTDAILTAHPRIYLAGCIAEACGWIQDYEREDREGAKFAAAVRAQNESYSRAQRSGSLLVMRPGSVA